jgi:hypothetical protein
MLRKAVALWVVGLLTAVPYATWYLLFEAPREQYALLIVLILFWVLGYWSVVGPLLALVKVRRVFHAVRAARSRDELLKTLHSADARAAAIDFIATENHIPRFLAERVYDMLLTHFNATRDP